MYKPNQASTIWGRRMYKPNQTPLPPPKTNKQTNKQTKKSADRVKAIEFLQTNPPNGSRL